MQHEMILIKVGNESSLTKLNKIRDQTKQRLIIKLLNESKTLYRLGVYQSRICIVRLLITVKSRTNTVNKRLKSTRLCRLDFGSGGN